MPRARTKTYPLYRPPTIFMSSRNIKRRKHAFLILYLCCEVQILLFWSSLILSTLDIFQVRMFIFHSKYIVYSKRCRENLQFQGQLRLLRPPKIAQSRDLVSRFVCAIRLESRILMFLVRLPFTCLVQSSTTVNTTCEIFFQYKVLWLIKPLEQCQLLQSATGVICKELQALKVKAIQCDRYSKVLLTKCQITRSCV